MPQGESENPRYIIPVPSSEVARGITGVGTSVGTSINYPAFQQFQSAGTTGDAFALYKSMGTAKPRPTSKPSAQKVRVVRSPRGNRVKIVGEKIHGLAPVLMLWADKLKKDIRVVDTNGLAAFEFYKRPMVSSRLKANGLCLFLTGSSKKQSYDVGDDRVFGDGKWRVGLDEIEALKAPAGLDSAEFPTYANITDEKNVFIGRVEGKFIYTMLYAPTGSVVSGFDGESELSAPKLDHEIMGRFVVHVLSRYEKMMKTHGEEILGAVTPVSFREFCGDSRRKRERTLSESIATINREIREIEKSLLAKARNLREAQKDLALASSGALDADFKRESQKLNDLVEKGLYEKFKIRNGFLVGMTSPVIIEDEGREFDLGQMVVCIKKDGSLKIEHPSRPEPFHPHIKGGSICLGSYRDQIPKLIGLERYALAFQVLREFLSDYNVADRYNSIEVCVGMQAPKEENVPAIF